MRFYFVYMMYLMHLEELGLDKTNSAVWALQRVISHGKQEMLTLGIKIQADQIEEQGS